MDFVLSAVLIIWVAWANSVGNALNVFWLRIVFGGYCTSWIKFPIQWQLLSKRHNDTDLTWWQVKIILGRNQFEKLVQMEIIFSFDLYDITGQRKSRLKQREWRASDELLKWSIGWHMGHVIMVLTYRGLLAIRGAPIDWKHPSLGWMLGMVMRILELCSCVNILNVKELEVKQIKNVWCEILKCDFGFWDQTCEGSTWVYVCVFTW